MRLYCNEYDNYFDIVLSNGIVLPVPTGCWPLLIEKGAKSEDIRRSDGIAN